MSGRSWGGLVLVLALLPAGARGQEEPPWDWNGVERVVAVGDVHGAYENFVAVLRQAGLVDRRLRWTGGRAHLVQLGDVVDRGPRSRDVMDLLLDLEKQAAEAGGRVHVLVGNHDAFNVIGILDYVSPEEYASYRDDLSEERRERYFEIVYRRIEEEARAKGEEPPPKDEEWRRFVEKVPLGYVEHRLAFGPEGRYGKWVRRRNAAVRIDGVVFTHGDWSERYAAVGVAEVNRRVRQELRGESPLEGGVILDPEGPLQYRGLAKVPLTSEAQSAATASVRRILELLGAERMVVGHTVTSGVIEPRFDGAHIAADCGMLELYRGGHRVALEIEAGRLRAIHPEGAVELPRQLDETTRLDYLARVARVDPTNVDVLEGLAELYHAAGRWAEAREAYERLVAVERPVPLARYRALGEVYERLGETAKAREAYLAYLDGLEKRIERGGAQASTFRNLLARFCLAHGIELDRAERHMRDAVAEEPDNAAYRVTLARILLARDRAEEAATLLEPLAASSPENRDALFYLATAYVRQRDTDKARALLERILAIAPDDAEAQEMLRRLGDGADEEVGSVEDGTSRAGSRLRPRPGEREGSRLFGLVR